MFNGRISVMILLEQKVYNAWKNYDTIRPDRIVSVFIPYTSTFSSSGRVRRVHWEKWI